MSSSSLRREALDFSYAAGCRVPLILKLRLIQPMDWKNTYPRDTRKLPQPHNGLKHQGVRTALTKNGDAPSLFCNAMAWRVIQPTEHV
jgi:hypothetical protein